MICIKLFLSYLFKSQFVVDDITMFVIQFSNFKFEFLKFFVYEIRISNFVNKKF